MQHRTVMVDKLTCTLYQDSESLFISWAGELVYILYANEPSLRAVYNRLAGNLTGEYLERIGFQPA